MKRNSRQLCSDRRKPCRPQRFPPTDLPGIAALLRSTPLRLQATGKGLESGDLTSAQQDYQTLQSLGPSGAFADGGRHAVPGASTFLKSGESALTLFSMPARRFFAPGILSFESRLNHILGKSITFRGRTCERNRRR